jgi:hypothetical protein
MPTCKTVNIQVDDMYYPDHPSSPQRGRPTSTKQPSDSNINLVLGPKLGLTQRLPGQLTISRNVTWTLTPVSLESAVGEL